MTGALLAHASERPGDVLARLLEAAPERLHIVRPYSGNTLWYDRAVDDALIAALVAGRDAPSLIEALGLHEGDAQTERPQVSDRHGLAGPPCPAPNFGQAPSQPGGPSFVPPPPPIGGPPPLIGPPPLVGPPPMVGPPLMVGPPPPRLPLLVLQTAGGQQLVTLRPVNSLGRHPTNTIQLLDKVVSKEHCIIELRGDHFVLRDLGSLNGTYINNERVRGEQGLRHGDEIVLGSTRCRFDDGSGAPAPQQPTNSEGPAPLELVPWYQQRPPGGFACPGGPPVMPAWGQPPLARDRRALPAPGGQPPLGGLEASPGVPEPPAARVSSGAWSGPVLEVLVEVGALAGGAAELAVPEALRTAGYDLLAVVDATDFEPIPGEPWSHVFRFPPGAKAARMDWRFPARKLAERPTYRLSVHFSVSGFPVGAARLTVAGDVSASAGGDLVLGAEPEDAPLLVVTREGSDVRARLAGTDLVATLAGVEDLFDRLGKGGADPREIGEDLGVSMALFDGVFRALGDREGARLRISADAPLAPFELIPLDRRKADGPLLGERVAVARHVASAPPALATPFGPGVACLRPEYTGSDARAELPLEEGDLRARYPGLVHCGTEAELDAVLQRTDIGLFHFAGHASGFKESMLRLEGAQVPPTRFRASRPLLSTARPLFFLNACEAGKANLSWAAAKNLAHTLIANGARGVVAPVIQVESGAARRAAQVFHEGLGEGKTVAEAVSAVRALRAGAGGVANTFASYLYFGGLGLQAGTIVDGTRSR